MSISDRFWSKVDKSGAAHPLLGTPCWTWMARRRPQGYGQFRVGEKTKLAHRVAWELEHGAVPALDVLHRCDNPPCCNPSHLFLGTDADNMADMVAKGRTNAHLRRGDANGSRKHPERRPRGDAHYSRTKPERVLRGEAQSCAKLTEQDVRSIRARQATGEAMRALGRAFGVSDTAIRLIVQRKKWKHVA